MRITAPRPGDGHGGGYDPHLRLDGARRGRGDRSGGATGLFWNSTPTITATPDATHGFAGWSGDTVTNPSSATTTVPMNSGNRTVTAGFVALTSGSLALSGAGNFANAYRDTIAGSPTTTSLTVTLSNPGQLPITISSLTLTGPFRGPLGAHSAHDIERRGFPAARPNLHAGNIRGLRCGDPDRR